MRISLTTIMQTLSLAGSEILRSVTAITAFFTEFIFLLDHNSDLAYRKYLPIDLGVVLALASASANQRLRFI